jgi:hypothetical protein
MLRDIPSLISIKCDLKDLNSINEIKKYVLL